MDEDKMTKDGIKDLSWHNGVNYGFLSKERITKNQIYLNNINTPTYGYPLHIAIELKIWLVGITPINGVRLAVTREVVPAISNSNWYQGSNKDRLLKLTKQSNYPTIMMRTKVLFNTIFNTLINNDA